MYLQHDPFREKSVEIDARKQRILLAVVQGYILTGRPVGSKSLAETRELGISPATIRSEMSALEKMGLLTQPHTSAGRVPTDLAYRFYVDMLMGMAKPSERDAEVVEKLFTARSREIEGLLREVSLLLSSLTHTTAMVFAPLASSDTVRHVDVVKLAARRYLLVVITARGELARRHVEVAEDPTRDVVDRVCDHMNAELRDRGPAEIDVEEVVGRARMGRRGTDLLRASLMASKSCLGEAGERVFVGGTANIVREMDSAGHEWVETLLEALERQYFIMDLLKEIIQHKHLTVRIGEENRALELRRFSLVGTSYPVAPDTLGSLGVVGPTCMDYERTIGMVEYVAESLGRRLMEPK